MTSESEPMIVLETQRLRLRRLTMDDFENVLELHQDPDVMRFVETGKPAAPQQVRAELELFIREYAEFPGFGRWAAVQEDTGQFIGWFALRRHADLPPTHATLGYRLGSGFWGRGYATEGSRALLHQAFTDLGILRVSADAMAVNQRSRRVMEKSGLTFVRTYFLQFDDPIPGTELGEVEYAVTKDAWRQRQRRTHTSTSALSRK